jgi:hypothetical protein
MLVMVSAMLASSAQAGLSLYYPMNEGSGTAVMDSSGNSLNGGLATIGTNVPQWVAGYNGAGYALQFGYDNSGESSEAAQNFVATPYNDKLDLTTKWTITAWVKSDDETWYSGGAGAYGGIIDGGNYMFQVGMTGDNQYYSWATRPEGDSTWQFGLGSEPPLGSWHNVAFSYNSTDGVNGTLKFYIDGVLKLTKSDGQTTVPWSHAMSSWTHGQGGVIDELLLLGYYGWSGHNLIGSLDDVAVWQDTLPDSSIVGIADGTYTPLTAPIPEPATMILLGLGALGLIRRK